MAMTASGMRCKWTAAALMLALHWYMPASDAPSANADPAPAKESASKETEVSPAVVTFLERFKNISMPAMLVDSVVKPGESLQYIVKWNGIPAGEATFSAKSAGGQALNAPARSIMSKTR